MKENWIEIVVCVAILIVTSPLLAYLLASSDMFFTFLESGNIKYIYRGDTLVKVIADVKGKRVGQKGEEKYKLIDLKPGEEVAKRCWERKFAVYWIGIWPLNSVKKFLIERRKAKENIVEDMPSKDWVEILENLEVDSLRATFTRPFLLPGVELGDRQTVNLLVVAKFEVVDTYIPMPQLKGKFMGNTSATLKAAIEDILRWSDSDPNHRDPNNKDHKLTLDQFIMKKKGEGGILSVLENDPETGAMSPFNQKLVAQTGLILVGATIPQWDPSDKTVRDALNARFLALKRKEALIIDAEGLAEKVNIQTKADANRITALGIAEGDKIKQKVQAIASAGGTNKLVTESVTTVLEMEAATSETSKLTTLVKGNMPAVLPVGGGKT